MCYCSNPHEDSLVSVGLQILKDRSNDYGMVKSAYLHYSTKPEQGDRIGNDVLREAEAYDR